MGEGILSKEELNKMLGKEDDLLRKSGRAVESSGKPGKERYRMMNEEKKQKNNVELDEQTKNAAEETVELLDEDLDKVSAGKKLRTLTAKYHLSGAARKADHFFDVFAV